jgi:hypothetical protein
LLLMATSIFVCCSKEDDNPKVRLEILPVKTASFPAKFKRDSIYNIPITYDKPNSCYQFDGFYYEQNTNIRTIAIQTAVLDQVNCPAETNNPAKEILKFKPSNETSYIFKLLKGKDAAGANLFEEIQVPVMP